MASPDGPPPDLPVADLLLPGARDPRDPGRQLTARDRTRSRDETAAIQRERLLDAVVQVVAEVGYEKATIKAIAKRAGIALATFYELYDGKPELVMAAFDSGVERLLAALEERFRAHAPGGWRSAVDAAFGALLDTLAANPDFAILMLVEIHRVGPQTRVVVSSLLDHAPRMFGAAADLGGPSDLDPEMVPLVVSGIYMRLGLFVREGRTRELPQLRRVLVDFAMVAFGQNPGPRPVADRS